jgi:malate dehydrogenase (oxaloacetate-decarboxylating)
LAPEWNAVTVRRLPSAGFSITIRVAVTADASAIGRLTTAVGTADGVVTALDVVDSDHHRIIADLTCDTADSTHADQVVGALEAMDGVEVRKVSDRTFLLHLGGKIEVHPKVALRTRDELSRAYTPGVARVCLAIAENPDDARRLTIKRNTIAVVTDGSAVLGLGNLGPAAALPVMEGKAALFKRFAGVDAWPVVLDTQDTDEIVNIVKAIAPAYGGINLEDIAAPRCFEIEARLREKLDIPVFHDDQHGTAIVVLAALINACKLTGRRIQDLNATMVGAGAAGIAVAKILTSAGIKSIVACDRGGAIHTGRDGLNSEKQWLAEHTNAEGREGSLVDVLEGADLFIGLSGPGVIQAADLGRMNSDPFVFAMANPNPEIKPEDAAKYVSVMATGRSDYPNQINNVLAFPGIFRGAFDVRAPKITEEMKMAAAEGIASVVSDEELRPDYIIPSVFNDDVCPAVARAVAEEAQREGITRTGALAPAS